jgi:hypothetical protein
MFDIPLETKKKMRINGSYMVWMKDFQFLNIDRLRHSRIVVHVNIMTVAKGKIVQILFSQIHQNYAKYTFETE